ncbi:replication protein [Pseudoalteromonas sp. Angola-30]|uniref:replication protein n=1 Tax=Pseudoalteromonas sp. Angola-30 TaxID=3025341 RepID=UPI0023588597|nr:replication protein [Pseudoalteromonas sp. Angola-30]MDC9527583.1 replication protein [Pseudoalteromonas sp. Angola-30]
MNNLAEVYKFPDKRGGEINQHDTGGYVKADIEQGYDRLAQKLTDTLANPPVKLSAREYQIVFAVMSKTYRWHKRTDWINNVQLSELTGISQSHISEIKNTLVEKGVLFFEGRNIGINPIVSDWGKSYPKTGKKKVTQKRVKTYPKTGNDLPENGEKLTQKRVTQKKETITKEKTKKINKKSLLETLDFSTWPALPNQQIFDDWVAMRKAKKASISQTVINNFGKQFQIAFQNGLSVDECLSECITRNWQGFKYSWIANANQSQYSSMAQRQSNNVGDQLAYLQDSLAHIPTPHDDEVL